MFSTSLQSSNQSQKLFIFKCSDIEDLTQVVIWNDEWSFEMMSGFLKFMIVLNGILSF